MVKALLVWRRVTKEDGRALTPEDCIRRRLHAFLGQLATAADPIPRFIQMVPLDVNQDIAVHLLHLLFSVPVGVYYMQRRIFAFKGELIDPGTPLVLEIPVEAFLVWRATSAVPQGNYARKLRVVTLINWQSMTCEWV